MVTKPILHEWVDNFTHRKVQRIAFASSIWLLKTIHLFLVWLSMCPFTLLVWSETKLPYFSIYVSLTLPSRTEYSFFFPSVRKLSPFDPFHRPHQTVTNIHKVSIWPMNYFKTAPPCVVVVVKECMGRKFPNFFFLELCHPFWVSF